MRRIPVPAETRQPSGNLTYPLSLESGFIYSHFGYNLKATDLQASIGCAQIDKMDEFSKKRKHNHAYLKSLLEKAGADQKLILPAASKESDPDWFGFLITCKEGVFRKVIVDHLESHGIQTRMLFAGNLIKHPCFDEMRSSGEGYRISGELTNTDIIMERSFWVGVYPGMTDEKLEYISKMITEALDLI